MEKKDDNESQWPRYIPVAMGMVHPEWLFMSHLFENEKEEKESAPAPANEISDVPQSNPTSTRPEIQINFRSRK
jgi:hypothetical protein